MYEMGLVSPVLQQGKVICVSKYSGNVALYHQRWDACATLWSLFKLKLMWKRELWEPWPILTQKQGQASTIRLQLVHHFFLTSCDGKGKQACVSPSSAMLQLGETALASALGMGFQTHTKPPFRYWYCRCSRHSLVNSTNTRTATSTSDGFATATVNPRIVHVVLHFVYYMRSDLHYQIKSPTWDGLTVLYHSDIKKVLTD